MTRESNPVGRRRQQQKAETRALILASARNLFEAQGYERTTIRGVAKGAGVGLGTVFVHFADKPELLAAAFYDDLAANVETAIGDVPEDAGVIDQFLHVSGVFYRYYAKRPALARVMLKNIMFLPSPRGQDIDARFLSTLIQLLADAREQGELQPETDCEVFADIFFGQYLYVLYRGLMAPAFDPQAGLERLRYTLVRVLAGAGRGADADC